MKKLLLLLVGLLPLALGALLNVLMLGTLQNTALPYGVIGLFFLLFWLLLGFWTRPLTKPAFTAAAIAHIPALAALALLLYQELALGRYWFSAFGVYPQFFYLPLINLAGRVAFFAHTMPPVYIAGFIMMFAVFRAGGALRRHKSD
jgi:hypothetical protein